MKKITVLLSLLVFLVTTTEAQLFHKKRVSKKEVPGQTAVLTLHPERNVLKGLDTLEYYLFFDLQHKCLFFTEKKQTYNSVSNFLPEMQIVGRKVEMNGPSIDPLTIFNKDQLQKESQRIGFGINKFNTFRIFNYVLIEDKPTSQNKIVTTTKKEVIEEPVEDKTTEKPKVVTSGKNWTGQ